MAKGRTSTTAETVASAAVGMPGSVAGATPTGHGIIDFTNDLKKYLDEARSKASTWLDQRGFIVDQLTAIRDTALALLRHIGSKEDAATVARAGRGRRRRRAAVRRKVGKPAKAAAGGRFSAATRRKMSLAQKRRWAAVRAGQVKKPKAEK